MDVSKAVSVVTMLIRWQGVWQTVPYAGFFSTLKSIWDWFYCPLYGVAGCPFWRGYERTELYDKTIGTCEFVRYNAVSVVERCPGSTVYRFFAWMVTNV